MAGTDELKRLIDFAADLVEAGVASFADGKLDLVDLFKFTPALGAGLVALEHLGDLKSEIADLNEEEQAELWAYCQQKLPASAGKVLDIVHSILDFLRPFLHLKGCLQPAA